MTMHAPSVHHRNVLTLDSTARGVLAILVVGIVFAVIWLLASAILEPTTTSAPAAWTTQDQVGAYQAYRADERAASVTTPTVVSSAFTAAQLDAATTAYRASERNAAPATDRSGWLAYRADERLAVTSTDAAWQLYRAGER